MNKKNGKMSQPAILRQENWLGGGQRAREVAKPAPRGPIFTRVLTEGLPEETKSHDNINLALEASQAAENQIAFVVIAKPNKRIIAGLDEAWDLHPLLEEDLHQSNQRPKIARYDDVLFLVVRTARYLDKPEEVEFSEFHILIRGNTVVIICQDDRLIDGTVFGPAVASLAGFPLGAKARLLGEPELLQMGPEAFIYQMLDIIVDSYIPVLEGLQIDKNQIERQVFSGVTAATETAATERIYRLSQEIIDVLHATTSLLRVLNGLRLGADKYQIAEDLKRYLQDVASQLTQVISEATELRDALSQILIVNSTFVTERQNEDMKKISGWAAIIFAPTLISSIYGMNFEHMPELQWALGYPLSLLVMFGFTGGLYFFFKWRKWM